MVHRVICRVSFPFDKLGIRFRILLAYFLLLAVSLFQNPHESVMPHLPEMNADRVSHKS